LHWSESGGPTVQRPARSGIGTNVIERMVRQHGGSVEFDWHPGGLRCHVVFPTAKPRAESLPS
jgi:two-component sensor histidine kinase